MPFIYASLGQRCWGRRGEIFSIIIVTHLLHPYNYYYYLNALKKLKKKPLKNSTCKCQKIKIKNSFTFGLHNKGLKAFGWVNNIYYYSRFYYGSSSIPSLSLSWVREKEWVPFFLLLICILQFAATRLRVLQNIFLAYLSHASLLLSRCCSVQ